MTWAEAVAKIDSWNLSTMGDHEFIAPSVSVALRAAEWAGLQDHPVTPTRVVPDGDGGIVFEFDYPPHFWTHEFGAQP